jgi:hypothetical protein
MGAPDVPPSIGPILPPRLGSPGGFEGALEKRVNVSNIKVLLIYFTKTYHLFKKDGLTIWINNNTNQELNKTLSWLCEISIVLNDPCFSNKLLLTKTSCMKDIKELLTDEIIFNKILRIRGVNVMLDSDLAELYGVTTKRLNEQVRRNLKRFPEDFMFRLTTNEKEEVVAKCDHLRKLKFSYVLPYAFTEHGTVMLASILNSDRAIQVNLQVVRIFNKMREVFLIHKELLIEIERIKSKMELHDDKIDMIFEAIKQLIEKKGESAENRKPIGYRR